MHEFHEFLDRRYAIALYEVAEAKNKVEAYLNELDEIVEVINSNKDLIEIMNHPDLSTARKKEIVENIFKDNILNDVLSFLLILIDKNRFLELKEIVLEIKKLHLETNRKVSAVATTVVPLTEDERSALISKLKSKYNKDIVLTEQIDKDILGGVLLKVDNDIIDGTIRGKLEKMRRLILKID